MNRWWIAAVLLIAGCGKSEPSQAALPKAEIQVGPPPVPRDITRPAGVVLTGFPESPELAACDAKGRWGPKAPLIDHVIVDPKEKAPLLPSEGMPTLTLYRDSLPFPQVTWKSGAWEVTLLVFPVGNGFAGRYCVMNHSETATAGQLKVTAADDLKIAADGKASASSLVFDLKVEPGLSQFITVTTADLGGKVPEDALDQATSRWEKLINEQMLRLPDAAAVTTYFADLAGERLRVRGCREAARTFESRLMKPEGQALRLLPDIPKAWELEAIEAVGIPTEFGLVSFRYQGAYNNRMFELKGCRPPEGFVIAVPEKLVARVDGKDVPVKDGILRAARDASLIELVYPR